MCNKELKVEGLHHLAKYMYSDEAALVVMIRMKVRRVNAQVGWCQHWKGVSSLKMRERKTIYQDPVSHIKKQCTWLMTSLIWASQEVTILITDVRYENAYSLLLSAVVVYKVCSLAKTSKVLVFVFCRHIDSLKQKFLLQ